MAFGDTLREFGIKVSLAFDGKKVEEAQEKVEKLAGKLRGLAAEMVGATAGVFEMQNLFTANARSLEDQAHLLGLNTEELQDYEYAAKVAADANREDLVGSLKTLGDTMDKARSGDVAARQALEQIGAASGDTGMIIGRLNDKTYKVTDAFKDMSKGISEISKTSPQAASRLTEMTLGSTKLYNLMREGPKAISELTAEGQKNFALNDNMIRQGAEMDKQISKLWLTFRKFGYEIGYATMKHLKPMIDQFTKWFHANKALISSGINAFLDTLADVLQVLWKDFLTIVEAVQPLIKALGGVKNVVQLLIGTWLAFKGISIAVSIGQMVVAIAAAAPAMAAFGAAALPVLGILAALAAAVVVVHDAYKLLTGSKFAETWTGKGLEKLTTAAGAITGKGSASAWGEVPAEEGPFGRATPTNGGSSNTKQESKVENHFNTTNTITLPAHTSASQASHIISKANTDSHEKLMIKAKMDAARSRRW